MDEKLVSQAKTQIDQLISTIEKVIIGKHDIIQLTVTAMLADGHVLFEDIPGVGKTMLIKTLAKSINGSYQRIQFTPDLLPSDIIGVSIFDNKSSNFQFRQGPIFTSVLLADEINRATPRTQSALLEGMSERRVTIDGHTYNLDQNFFVLATQNPVEYEGTYPLPEAQLDRFLFRLAIGYPRFEEEKRLMLEENREIMVEQLQSVIDESELGQIKQLVTEVFVSDPVVDYALKLVEASRQHPQVQLGISPRGSLALIRAARAFALTEGRGYVVPNDVQTVIGPVFGHRLILRNGFADQTTDVQQVLAEILASVTVPVK